MSGIIYTGNTTLSHGLFISWLNSLLVDYVPGFYDDAIQNILQLSFIRKHSLLMVEQYPVTGFGNMLNFITVLPTDRVNNILMVHDMDGKPYLYNKTDVSNLFVFDTDGILTRFYENVVIPLYNPDGSTEYELFITFMDVFGIKAPLLKLRLTGGVEKSAGLLDVPFEGRYSGSYLVDTTPMDEVPQIQITNISDGVLKISIPLLPKLTVDYTILPKRAILVPVTPLSDYFVRKGQTLDAIKYKFL